MRILTATVAVALVSLALAIVPSLKEMDRYADQCSDIMDASPAARIRFRKHQYPEDRESYHHIYCLAVMSGLFSERYDYNLEEAYEFYSMSMSWDSFTGWIKQCFVDNRVEELGLCKYERMFRMFKCFQTMYGNMFNDTDSAVSGAPKQSGQLCPCASGGSTGRNWIGN